MDLFNITADFARKSNFIGKFNKCFRLPLFNVLAIIRVVISTQPR
jgi:hypothetical protein